MNNICECENWARDGVASVLFLEHHPNCRFYYPEPEIRTLLMDLINGIEDWANDEDGIHSNCWEAYVAACSAVGMWDRPLNKEAV